MTQLTIDQDYLVATLQGLVRIDSVNPSLDPQGGGEAEIAGFIAGKLESLGIEPVLQELAPGRYNVIGVLPGSGEGRSLMLNAHTDTVGVQGMPEPFSAEIRDGKVYGRGAFDMKGSLAGCLAALKAIVETGTSLKGDLIFTAVADEEYVSRGTEAIIEHYHSDAAIVTEPTSLQVCIAHKGYAWLEVETLGRAAHGSRFNEGIDANMMMGRFLAQLDKLAQELLSRPPHPLVGPPSLHAATLHGGTEWSMYAEHCKVQIERRIIPGETHAQVVSEIQALLESLSQHDRKFHAVLKPFFMRRPFEISPEAEIVQSLRRCAAQQLGYTPPYYGEAFWMDSALLDQAGIETVIFGPTGGGAHAHLEWVEIGSVVDFARVLAHTAVEYCNLPLP